MGVAQGVCYCQEKVHNNSYSGRIRSKAKSKQEGKGGCPSTLMSPPVFLFCPSSTTRTAEGQKRKKHARKQQTNNEARFCLSVSLSLSVASEDFCLSILLHQNVHAHFDLHFCPCWRPAKGPPNHKLVDLQMTSLSR